MLQYEDALLSINAQSGASLPQTDSLKEKVMSLKAELKRATDELESARSVIARLEQKASSSSSSSSLTLSKPNRKTKRDTASAAGVGSGAAPPMSSGSGTSSGTSSSSGGGGFGRSTVSLTYAQPAKRQKIGPASSAPAPAAPKTVYDFEY